jgi:hypothetical protein
VKLASKRRRRQCRAVPGRRSPASGPGRRRDGAPAADRACRGLVVVSGGWQAAVAGVCSCWRCCGQWRAAHRAAPGRRSPASEPGRRPDGTPAADRACRGLVRISGCSITGSASGSSFSRSLKPATKRRRRQRRAAPGRRSPASGPGRRRDGAPAADRACRGVVRVSGCSIAGSSAGSSFSRSVKPATKRRRRQCRAVPGRRSPASGPGRRRDGAPAADRACRGVVSDVGRCSITGSSAGSSFSRSLKPATKRRRRQRRAAPGRRSPASGPGRRPDGTPAADRACRGLVRISGCSITGSASGSSFSRSLKPASKRRRRQRRAAPGRRSPASGPGRRRDGAPAADRACRGLVKVSVCWQASVAGVCQGSRRRGSCWWCCGQGVQLVGQFGRVFVLSIGETGHEATTAPASSSTWKAIAGKRARAKARRRTGSRSGVPWRGPCCGGARSPAVRPGLPSSRSVKLASKRRRRQCRAVPGRRSPASGPGRRRDGAPAADRACRGLVVVSGGWQAAVAGVCSCWRCCGQWRAAHRAAPGRRSPASEPGRRPDGTPAADRACRGLVRISGCSITGSASGSSFSRSLKPATKRRRRQRRAVPGRRSPASGPGRRRDGTPAADRACRGLVRISGGARSPAVLPGLRSLDR